MQQRSEILTITQEDKFEQIIKDYYSKGVLQLKQGDNSIPIEFIKSIGNKIYFKIDSKKNLPDECLITAKLETEIVYGTMKQAGLPLEHIFVFTPVKFQLISFFRKHERVDLNENNSKQIVFLTNIISSSNLKESITAEKKKVEQIKSKITEKLENIFDTVKVIVVGEKQVDPRFRYFMANTHSIYIADINNPDSVTDKEQFAYYNLNIYATDYTIKKNNAISEITTPLLLHGKMPYGYIQINSSKILAPTIVDQIKNYARHLDDFFLQSGIVHPVTDKFIVTNVSSGGFAIAFKDKKFLRIFPTKQSMMVEMILPNNQTIKLYSTACNITLDSKMITIGFQIIDISDEYRNTYEDFIKSVSQPKNN